MASSSILVGDIGGTHVRFATAHFAGRWVIENKQDIEQRDKSFHDLLVDYLGKLGSDRPDAISLAVAGPVIGRAVAFTNRQWYLTEEDLLSCGFRSALLLNDFAALAIAAPDLSTAQLFALGSPGESDPSQPLSVIGAGTGFGASLLVRKAEASFPLPCEAGHIGFAPGNEREDAVLGLLRDRFGRVSVERILSGPGLENLFWALRQLHGMAPEKADAPTIMAQAENGDTLCQQVRAIFCGVYGSVAGDLALAHGARGGIFLAGGIAQKMRDVLAQSDFRKRFEDKGRLSYYVRSIPTQIITDPDATLLGAAMAIRASVRAGIRAAS
jgi:glucokinase